MSCLLTLDMDGFIGFAGGGNRGLGVYSIHNGNSKYASGAAEALC